MALALTKTWKKMLVGLFTYLFIYLTKGIFKGDPDILV